MNMRKFLAIALLQCLLSSAVFAQNTTINGKVVDSATGEPISGVSILADKRGVATTTGADGAFSLKVDPKVTTIVFSYVGYSSQTVPAASVPAVLRLAKTAVAMDEVVVIGYGTVRKSSLTGAVSKLKNERLEEAPVARLDQAMQGKIAGVQVQNISSEAGSDPKIRIRGLSSVNASANPFVVVDGQPVPDGLSFINPADVESIEVLKDASSAAIYGSRAAGGVIIVTTKSGKADKVRYNLKTSTGTKQAYERYPMMTMTEYGNLLFYEASLRAKDPAAPPPTTNNIMSGNERAAYVLENGLMGGPTDWQSEALRNAAVHNIQLNVSGGSRTAKYYISGAYQKDQGLMYHSEYDRYSIRAKLETQLSNRVKFNFNVNPTYIKRERPSVGYIDFVRFYSFLPVYHNDATAAFANQGGWAVRPGDFAQARHFNGRVYSGTMPDGSFWSSGTAVDPFATANNTPKSVMETRSITSNDYRILTSGDININIAKGLDFKTLASAYFNYSSALDFAKRGSNRDGDVNRGQYNDRKIVDLLVEYTLNYQKKIKDHDFNLLAGWTSQKVDTRDQQAVGLDYASDNITTLNNALVKDQLLTYDSLTKTGINSALARLVYNFKGKYLVTASIRGDETSFFAPGKKWGVFPAVSVGWVLSQEKFMEPVAWINNLKLRASYGEVGNNRVDASASAYPYVDLLYAANYPLGSGTGSSNSGYVPSSAVAANPNLTWETTRQFNLGFDLSMLRNTLSLTVDAYQSRTEKLLLLQSSQLFTGVSRFWNNIGSLQNRGIEVELTANVMRKKHLRWTILGNMAHNRNKVLELGEESRILNQGERTEVYQNRVGDPLIQYLGYKTDGVWLSQAQIDEARAKGLTSSLSNVFVPGGLKLVDVNGDNKIDADDRVVMGSPYPDFIYGITNNITYKAFDISLLVQGSKGGELINGDPNYNETKRINKNYNENRWLSPLNPGDGQTPYSTVGFNWMLTDYVVEDASYVTLREVIIGYTLPTNLTKRIHIGSARFYVSAQNLLFHTAASYRGINTEARFTSGPYNTPLVDGYQRGGFPLPKTFLVGLDINF